MKAKINEIFYSIQGEGDSVGIPAVFVRFSGCNYNCPGCDTKYHKNGEFLSIKKIVSKIKSFNSKTKLVIFTGGEPLLQQEAIVEIIKQLNPKGGFYGTWFDWWFQIETNGSIEPNIINEYICHEKGKTVYIQYNVSPKLSSFYSKSKTNLSNIHLWGRFILKLVITSEKDILELKQLQEKYKIINCSVWLMPEGASKKEQEKNMPMVVKLAKKYNYNFSPRLHILIWDQKKGI